jgi:hypothetical protein
VTLTWPGWVTEITPPHAHWHVEVLSSAGTPPTVTFGEPGAHGLAITGMHG